MLVDCKSDYSLLESLMTPEALVKKAKELGLTYLGIADSNAGGLLDFYLTCKEAGIKPLLGLRFNITDKLEAPTDSQVFLYAQNNNGYHNLIKVATKVNLEGAGNLLLEWLNELSPDLVCVLPVGNSPNELRSDQGDLINKRLKELFKGKMFYGLYNRECAIDDIWLKKAEVGNVPYLFLSGAKYFLKEDLKAYKVIRAIKEKTIVEKVFESIWLDESVETTVERFKSYTHHDYLNKFLSLIDVDIPTPGLKVPKFSFPKEFASSYDYLVDLCRKGYKDKMAEFPDKNLVKERMATELKVIKDCRLEDYFLLVFDVCRHCDEHGIPRGISRGSAAGSLILYFLDVSRVNPLEYNLLFERFLNPDRTQTVEYNGEKYLTDAPDVDLDVSQTRRQEVVDWLNGKYGNVCRIGTFTTFSSKLALRETVRSFGRSEGEAGYVAGFIESIHGKVNSIEETYQKNSKFKEWVDKNKEIYKIALTIQDLKKNMSAHAAGLLISSDSINNMIPLTLGQTTGEEVKQYICSMYDMRFAAKSTLLKLDLLGLRTLVLLKDSIDLIKTRPQKKENKEILKDKKIKNPAWENFLAEHL